MARGRLSLGYRTPICAAGRSFGERHPAVAIAAP
jgi:hypothetical protein